MNGDDYRQSYETLPTQQAHTEFLWKIEVAFSDPLFVTPQEAAAVTAAMEQGAQHVKVRQNVIAVNAIRRVSESDQLVPFDEEIKAITAGNGRLTKSEPLLNPIDQSFRWAWRKRVVSKKLWETNYSKTGSFFKLEEAGTNGVWVAWRHILLTNELVNREVFECTKAEVIMLDRKTGAE